MKPWLPVVVILAINAWGQSAAPGSPCVLVAGSGCGNLVIEKTRRIDVFVDAQTEKWFASQGLAFSFRAGDVLDTIVATSKDFKTNLGVSPGDTETRVRQLYGKPIVAKGTLRKGEADVGTLGDRVLAYPGVRFVISKGKVWAIVIVPRSS
jgi:hypothetical protein